LWIEIIAMHEPVKNQLENLLRGRVDAESAADVEAHLCACAGCATKFERLREQSRAIRTLRAEVPVAPSDGFYARVMRRVENSKPGFWSLLLDPFFGRRLVYATGTLALFMAALLLATAPEEPELAQTPVRVLAVQPAESAAVFSSDERTGEDVQQGRERFLVTLASFSD
jgi:anti-sigma factor RsiW